MKWPRSRLVEIKVESLYVLLSLATTELEKTDDITRL